eukprot:6384849-Alexandrium_andersonii.AAC.1
MLRAEHNESWRQLHSRLGTKFEAKHNEMRAELIECEAKQIEREIKLHEAEYWHHSDGGYKTG